MYRSQAITALWSAWRSSSGVEIEPDYHVEMSGTDEWRNSAIDLPVMGAGTQLPLKKPHNRFSGL
jgi:hypothetical protein